MERCAHSGPEANDGPCSSCADGPAPLPPDPRLSYAERFGRTEWGIPQVPADVEVTFKAVDPTARKWTTVAFAFFVGVAVVTGLVATMLLGNPTGGRRQLTAGVTPRTPQSAAAPAARTAPASPSTPAKAKPKPGPALRDAFIAAVAQPAGRFRAAYTISVTGPGTASRMSGEMDAAGPTIAAKVEAGPVGGPSMTGEYVIKDGAVYNRVTGRPWERATSAVHLPSDPFPSAAALKSLDYVGTRTVDGRKLHLFRGDRAALLEDGALRNGLSGVSALRDVRYDVLVTADGVPVRMTASAKVRFTRGDATVTATLKLDYRISRFGKPVDIKTPTVGAPQSG